MSGEEYTTVKKFVDEVRCGEFIGKHRMYYGTGVKDMDGEDLFEGDILDAIDGRGYGVIVKYRGDFIIIHANTEIGKIGEATWRRRAGNIINDSSLFDGSKLREWQVLMAI